VKLLGSWYSVCYAVISMDCLLSSLRSSLPSPLPAVLTLCVLNARSSLPAWSFVAALPEVGVAGAAAEMDGRWCDEDAAAVLDIDGRRSRERMRSVGSAPAAAAAVAAAGGRAADETPAVVAAVLAAGANV
jgi:hypothetical protein